MKHILLRRLVPVCVLIVALATGCQNDQWDEHYDEYSFNLPDKTLKGYIQGESDLSIFSEMLAKTGLDTVINASQAYTVWAPTNDALAGIDMSDLNLVRNIVTNHISRSRITTSGIVSRRIRTLGGKYVVFSQQGSDYLYGDNDLIEPNVSTSNGLVHKINGYAPYLSNLWEFIGLTDNLDSLRSYLYGKNQVVFDPVNSIEIGENDEGQIIYDSVFVASNPVLEKIGALGDEDSIYTAIMPDNDAWNEAYGRVVNFFKFSDRDGGAERQREMTQYTLVRDMVFPEEVKQPVTEDSLVTTTGDVFYDPQFIFDNTQQEELSNGLAYVTNLMPYADTISWFKEISVEAEETEGRTNKNNNVYTLVSYGSGLSISGDKLILAQPTGANSTVEFSIPNVLSGTYNVYCVFAPAGISTKVKFRLTYVGSASGSTRGTNITPANNVTAPDDMTKMLVTQFSFPYATVVDEDYDRVPITLQVINTVTTTEEQSGDFTSSMYIDRIILEPVSE